MTAFCVKLKNRGLIHLEGEERHEFLQGLITNDIEKLKPDNMLYACLLTPQGKFLHDFFVIEGLNEQGGFTLLDCEGGERAQDLYNRLNMYRLRKDVQISVEENRDVYSILSFRTSQSDGEISHNEMRSLAFARDDSVLSKDPRHPDMGWRSFSKPDLPEHPFETWDAHRISLTIPDSSRDLTPEKSTMDEANMDQINAIDYDKGCYIGQELTARMHYRGLGKRKLQTVNVNDLPEGAELRSYSGDIGIALVKAKK